MCDGHFGQVLQRVRGRAQRAKWIAQPALLARDMENAHANTRTFFIRPAMTQQPLSALALPHMRDYLWWTFDAAGSVVARQFHGATQMVNFTAAFERFDLRGFTRPFFAPQRVAAVAPEDQPSGALGLDFEELQQDRDEDMDESEGDDDDDAGSIFESVFRHRNVYDLMNWTRPVVMREVTAWLQRLRMLGLELNTRLPMAEAPLREWRCLGNDLLCRNCAPQEDAGPRRAARAARRKNKRLQ